MTDLRTLERDSIRAFVQQAADDGYLSGRVLDYGCGRQPYRDIVEAAGGEYHGYDRASFPANTSGEDVGEEPMLHSGKGHYDALLCTQVVQYRRRFDPGQLAADFLHAGSHLVLTYPTNWPEVEPEDLHRFTKAGMERLLTEAGFEIVRHERRADFYIAVSPGGPWTSDHFATGYGVIARA